MSSRFLPVVIANCDEQAAELTVLAEAGRLDFERTLLLATVYRRRGIASLLAFGSAGALHEDLRRAGAVLATFLTSRRGNEAVRNSPIGFFDAVACGDMTTADRIAQFSPRDWRAGECYEDDFLYVDLLMARFHLGALPARIQAMLARYRVALEGVDDPRLTICESLLGADQQAFDAALTELIQGHEQRYRTAFAADEILEEVAMTEGKLFVEGLALLEFARRSGLRTQPDYLLMPSLAQRAPD